MYQKWARVRLDGGGVILEIFTVGGGGQSHFMVGGWWGSKKNFFDHFFPFYKTLAKFSAIFIILSPQFEIFMGVPPP